MLLFDQARGNPEEAARILRCARLFARSEDTAQRLSELCNEVGSNATWHKNIVEELQDREDVRIVEQRWLEAGCAAKAKAELEPLEEPAFLDDEGPSDELPTRITLPRRTKP